MESVGAELTLGKSIIVPSVQELAKGCLTQVPKKYIQFDENSLKLATNDDNKDQDDALEVPTINMEALICGSEVELEKLKLACRDWGFFQLINHGVSSSLVEKIKLETQEFFNLPIEEKKKYWQSPADVEGFGQAFVVSDDQKLDWADMFYMTTLPKHLRKPYLFPMLPLPYRDTCEHYTTEIQKLTRKILDYIAKTLNIDSNEFEGNVFGEGHQSIRVNYYPPCPEPEKVIGLTPHTDAISLITILLQLNGIEGLQIKKNSKWVTIQPQPDAFIVNIGDILEIMSNGLYKSVMHRAVVNATKERLSLVVFQGTALDGEIGPIPSLINSTNPAKFKRMGMVDYWKGFLARPLDGNTYLDVMRIEGNDDN